MKAVVTGSRGFVGSHLTRLLEDHGIEVVHANIRDGVDIRDYESLRNLLDIHRPDYIYHLAAQAFVPESFNDPIRTFEINTLGSINLLEAIRNLGIKTRLHMAGTSEEYGSAQYGDGQITEEALPEPKSPYAISKIAMDFMGRHYSEAYGFPVVVTRAFNHAGPGRGEMYAESAFAKQIAEVEAKKRDKVEHGNLESVRNYTDVRDIVKAYTAAIELPPDVYNIASPRSVKMQEIMDILIKLARVPIKTEVNPAFYRPSDFSFKEPSAEKFTELTGWKPQIPLEKTLEDVLNYWRERV